MARPTAAPHTLAAAKVKSKPPLAPNRQPHVAPRDHSPQRQGGREDGGSLTTPWRGQRSTIFATALALWRVVAGSYVGLAVGGQRRFAFDFRCCEGVRGGGGTRHCPGVRGCPPGGTAGLAL